MSYITLDKHNLAGEHICCGISDKKSRDSYEMKKAWLGERFDEGYVFRKLDERAKVFIEYGPAEHAWVPVDAPGYLILGCFWVSGRFKQSGHGKALLASALEDARKQGKAGLAAITGKKKFHFMSDGAWLKRQGFTVADSTEDGFELLVLSADGPAAEPAAEPADGNTPPVGTPSKPVFRDSVKTGKVPGEDGISVLYSHRCVFTDYHVTRSLKESAEKRGIPLHITKIESREQARDACSPATLFSMYYNGRFVTTDVSACMDSRIDKFLKG